MAAYYSHNGLQTATTGVQETITCSTSGWLMQFSPSVSASWVNMQSCNRHTAKFKQWAAEEGERVSKTYSALVPLKETELWEMLGLWGCVCACVYLCEHFHLSQLYMEISVLCGLHGTAGYSEWFRGPLGSDGKTNRFKQKLRNFTDILRNLEDLTRQCCPLVSTVSMSDIF